MVKGGQRWSMVSDHRELPPDHRSTTAGPPVNHRQTIGQWLLTASQWLGQRVWLPHGVARGSMCQPQVKTASTKVNVADEVSAAQELQENILSSYYC
nr:hypothetical protein [Tanacetum cinerariifolium]